MIISLDVCPVVPRKPLSSMDEATDKAIHQRAEDDTYSMLSGPTGKKTMIDKSDVELEGKGKAVSDHNKGDDPDPVDVIEEPSIEEPRFPRWEEYQKHCMWELVGPKDPGRSERGRSYRQLSRDELYEHLKQSGRLYSFKAA